VEQLLLNLAEDVSSMDQKFREEIVQVTRRMHARHAPVARRRDSDSQSLRLTISLELSVVRRVRHRQVQVTCERVARRGGRRRTEPGADASSEDGGALLSPVASTRDAATERTPEPRGATAHGELTATPASSLPQLTATLVDHTGGSPAGGMSAATRQMSPAATRQTAGADSPPATRPQPTGSRASDVSTAAVARSVAGPGRPSRTPKQPLGEPVAPRERPFPVM
jgi:hypothetical protein